VFPAEHGLLPAGGLPVAESHTQLAHTRPEPFSIYAGLRRWLADGISRRKRKGVHKQKGLNSLQRSFQRPTLGSAFSGHNSAGGFPFRNRVQRTCLSGFKA
jgi:hypothetical protein